MDNVIFHCFQMYYKQTDQLRKYESVVFCLMQIVFKSTDTMCRSLFFLLPFLASRRYLNKQDRFLQCDKEHGVEFKGRSILKIFSIHSAVAYSTICCCINLFCCLVMFFFYPRGKPAKLRQHDIIESRLFPLRHALWGHGW